MQLAGIKASHDIAVMTAVFAAGIAISCEPFSAAGTGEGIYRFASHLFRMGVPPKLTAVGRTELYFFLAWCLTQLLSALQTKSLIRFDAGVALRLYSGQIVGTTIRLYIVLREPDGFGDRCIAISVLPQGRNAFSLLIGHALPSCLRTSVLTIQWRRTCLLNEEKSQSSKNETVTKSKAANTLQPCSLELLPISCVLQTQ